MLLFKSLFATFPLVLSVDALHHEANLGATNPSGAACAKVVGSFGVIYDILSLTLAISVQNYLPNLVSIYTIRTIEILLFGTPSNRKLNLPAE